MLPTLRVLCCAALLLFFTPIRDLAATISISVGCGNTPDYAYTPGGASCVNYTNGETAEASVLVDNSPFSVSVGTSAGDFGSASASYSATLEITITNGTGAGEYAPCFGFTLAGFFFDHSYSFGSLVDPPVLCPTTLASNEFIPFLFGVPQIEQLSLSADGVAGTEGGGNDVLLQGFTVLDANGNPLPGAVVSVVDTAVPESRLWAPLSMALALGWVMRRWRPGRNAI
jgi:hypothetical protein